MNLLFLLIYFGLITTVIEIHVILFRLTGLKSEVSRFQVISMMTGTGFTTGESELILGHPIRRKLATFLILFGAFSLAVIISSISSFLSDELRTKEILFVTGGIMFVFVVLKLASIQKVLFNLFNKKMKRNIELGDLPIREVFLTDKQDYILNLHIYKDSSLFHKTFKHAIKEHDQVDIVILFIKRGEVKITKNMYHTKFHEGDQILLFGNKQVIKEKFKNDIKLMEEEMKKQDHTPITEY
ncbi:MAG TPA: hypothetical protein VEY70_07675 [Metabacillus sp.]|nr:hypothetical protein [Metabacillus sp.]